MNARVLIIAHGHPDLQKGGAEVAARNLHRALLAEGVESALIARTDGPSHGGSAFSSRGGTGELFVHTGMQDAFDFRARDPHMVGLEFGALLRRYQPTVIHFQHYVHLGLEWLHVARRTCPDAKLVLTLHEYLALCYHGGQMLKRPGLELCYRSDPDDCARCYPERGGGPDFFLRREFIRSAFALIDQFVTPSAFLKQRYVEWGLDASRIEVLENVQMVRSALPPRRLAPGELRGRFAFFGQANAFKGLDLALEAFLVLPNHVRQQVHFALHAAHLDEQPTAFREKLGKLLHAARRVATMHGRYEPADLPRRMENTDWVLVPSIWWENSPMVIQEAFGHGRPVLCSDIGGMAEKVRHGVDGWHFPARDARALASTIIHLVTQEGLWDKLQAGVETPLDPAEITRRHLALYRRP
ncbi:MAG TPA: glycosyltransferase family 4 protein [Polyangiaceae bacterium]